MVISHEVYELMMKFDALLRRGAGVHLMTPGDAGTGDSAMRGGARLKPVLGPVTPFLHWWLRELKEMLPQSLRRTFSERRLLVRASHSELCIADPNSLEGEETCHSLRQQDSDGGIASAPPKQQRCDLLLDNSLVLVRELELPLDAEATLRRVLSFSMDRYTPFNEENVLFDYKVIRRNGVNKKIALNLYVAPREGLEPVFQRLAGMAIEPVAVDVVTADATGATSGRAGVNLLSTERRSGTGGMGLSTRLLGLSALTLLVFAVASPFIVRQQTTAQLESQVEQLRGQVQEAETDRMALAERVERMRQIQARTTAMPAILDVLLELTRLIPDDAWAGQVTIKSGRVRLTGEASSGSDLLAHLSNSSIFSDPKFEAPLTQNPRTGRERFVISLAIKGYGDGA